MSDPTSALVAIEQTIGQGELEKALDDLLALLDNQPEMAELMQVVRVNQADFFQIKSQVIRNTLSAEEARRYYNQISNNALQVIQRLKEGKTTIADPVAAPAQQPPQRAAWRYYTAGGVVTLGLALLGWNIFGKKIADCPDYANSKTERVMVLPFLQTGSIDSRSLAINIMDDLNDLLRKDTKLSLSAEANVNKTYDIESSYPSPTEAVRIAGHCGVDLLVWGKCGDKKDTVEVRYKFARPKLESSSADPRLNKLLSMVDEGVWVDNVKNIPKLLYLLLASQNGDSEMAFRIFNEVFSPQKMAISETGSIDTAGINQLLVRADFQRAQNDTAGALNTYNYILTLTPDNEQALQRRGALNYAAGKYWMAAHDFQAIEPDPAKVDTSILKVRSEAYLKCGWPEKARQDLEQIKKLQLAEPTWIKKQELAISDSLKVYNARLETTKLLAAKRPGAVNTQIELAQAHNAVGETKEALRIAEKIQKKEPTNKRAIEAVVEAATQSGDMQKVDKVTREAERAGVSTKDIRFIPPNVKALDATVQRKQ